MAAGWPQGSSPGFFVGIRSGVSGRAEIAGDRFRRRFGLSAIVQHVGGRGVRHVSGDRFGSGAHVSRKGILDRSREIRGRRSGRTARHDGPDPAELGGHRIVLGRRFDDLDRVRGIGRGGICGFRLVVGIVHFNRVIDTDVGEHVVRGLATDGVRAPVFQLAQRDAVIADPGFYPALDLALGNPVQHLGIRRRRFGPEVPVFGRKVPKILGNSPHRPERVVEAFKRTGKCPV